MPKRRWLCDGLSAELESLSEEELDRVVNLLDGKGLIPDVTAERGYVQSNGIGWDGKNRIISFRVDALNRRPKFVDKGILIDYDILREAGNIVAQKYGLEIKRGKVEFTHAHVGASDAARGEPQYYHKEYYYVMFSCPIDSVENFLDKALEKVKQINTIAWRVACEKAKREAIAEVQRKKAEKERIAKLVAAAEVE